MSVEPTFATAQLATSREYHNGAQDPGALQMELEALQQSLQAGNALREADGQKFQERLAEQVGVDFTAFS